MWYIKHQFFNCKRGTTTAERAFTMFHSLLHLDLHTCCDKNIQSFITTPDIEQKQLCSKLNPH